MPQAYEDPDLLAALPGLSIVGEGGVTTGDGSNVSPGFGKDDSESKAESRSAEECALLERAAHYALMMNADLQVGNPIFSPLPELKKKNSFVKYSQGTSSSPKPP